MDAPGFEPRTSTWILLSTKCSSGIGRNPGAKLSVGAIEHRRTVHEGQGFEIVRGELAQAVTRLCEVFSGSGKLHPAEVHAGVCRNENAATSLEVERDLTCAVAGNVDNTQIGHPVESFCEAAVVLGVNGRPVL